MADFETMIRGALSTKDASVRAVRLSVYQSSRKALMRLIENNRSLTVEAALQRQNDLEIAIGRIEQEFSVVFEPAPSPAQPHVPEPPVQPQTIQKPTVHDPLDSFNQSADFSAQAELQAPTVEAPVSPPVEDPFSELKEILSTDGYGPEVTNDLATPVQQIKEPVVDVNPQPVPQSVSQPVTPSSPQVLPQTQAQVRPIQQSQPIEPAPIIARSPQPAEPLPPLGSPSSADEFEFSETENLPLEFSRRRKFQKRLMTTLGILIILVLCAWAAFYLYNALLNGTLLSNSGPSDELLADTSNGGPGDYLTIVEPGDLSALITAGRGQAQIVDELNTSMIRLVSVRDENNRSEGAKPILMKLRPGILEQISGKNVTFEIYAKSGTSGPAQFTITCLFKNSGNCGRKRFRVGIQPEASIFAVEFKNITNTNQNIFIAINTDTTRNATVTGRGDVLDVIYARLRVN
ncbi:MAG: hypothetical protein AAF217_14290 [Pseudomonadota bacterium]